ncbi:MAG: RDD family protein [Chitinophagaceae bacterium]|nr:MAG: RDD family protein [Chitinophagaceae bacterium]
MAGNITRSTTRTKHREYRTGNKLQATNFELMEERENEYWEQKPQPVVPAPMVKRLINWVIDILLIGFLASVLLAVVGRLYPPLLQGFIKDPYGFRNTITLQFCYALFLSIQEGFFRGKTVGKALTGTRAVLADGSPLPTEKAFLRSLIRVIPFEPLTIFLLGRPLHDVLSGTVVADEGLNRLP